jgi:UDP-glucose 4-epimerase
VLPLPESPYGIAKYCAEQYIGLYNRLHGTRHSMLRLANVYGPRQDPAGDAGVITIFCANVLAGESPLIYGDGAQTRDYVYVGDAVRAFLAAADCGRPGTWNVGAGLEISVLDLLSIIGEVAGQRVTPHFAPPRPGELLRSAVAVERAAADLGWRPGTPLREGIRTVYGWIAAGAPDRAPC